MGKTSLGDWRSFRAKEKKNTNYWPYGLVVNSFSIQFCDLNKEENIFLSCLLA